MKSPFNEPALYMDAKGEARFTSDLTNSAETYEEKKYLVDRYLTQNDLFDRLVKQAGVLISGEEEARKAIILTTHGRLVLNSNAASFNLLVQDDSGKGKDHTTRNSLKATLPKQIFLHRTRISPTAFTYWHKDESEWTWNGKVVYLEDVSESILNCDVLKTMLSGGTSTSVVVRQKTVDISINGKPVIIITSASATPSPEATRRFFQIHLTDSARQTSEVMKHIARVRQGNGQELDQDLIKCQEYLSPVNVLIPYAEILATLLNSEKVILRTNFSRFLDYISASAALYQYQRERNENNWIIASLEDYERARDIFLPLIRGSFISLTRDQEYILDIFKKAPLTKYSASQILVNLKGRIKSLVTVQTRLRELVSYGFITSSIGKDDLNRDIEQFECAPVQESFDLPSKEQLKIEIDKVSKVSETSKITKITKTSLEKHRDTLDTLVILPKKALSNEVSQ